MMPSRQCNSRLAMLSKYRAFVGLDYEPPHGCFRLIEQVYRDLYGIELGGLDEGLDQADSHSRTARIQRALAELCIEVDGPREGDVVIIRNRPWHIGLVIEPGLMLHSYRGGTSCIENYQGMRWKSRVQGFFRHKSR